MEYVCHRCGTALHESDPFCPHCGAPQIRYEAAEETIASNVAPAQRYAVRNANSIAWREAIRAAALIAIPAGLLSTLIGLEALWVVTGGIVTISLYRRRTGILTTSRVGWRIGAVLGLFAAVVAAATNGATLMVQRYALHQGGILDKRYHDLILTNMKMVGELFAGSNPDVAAALAQTQHFWLSPNGVAAMVLSSTVQLTIVMLIFAAAGGALGARLMQRAPHPSAR